MKLLSRWYRYRQNRLMAKMLDSWAHQLSFADAEETASLYERATRMRAKELKCKGIKAHPLRGTAHDPFATRVRAKK